MGILQKQDKVGIINKLEDMDNKNNNKKLFGEDDLDKSTKNLIKL